MFFNMDETGQKNTTRCRAVSAAVAATTTIGRDAETR